VVSDETPKKVVLFGIGAGANTARRYFEADTPHEIVGYVVDREHLNEQEFEGRPVATMEDAVATFPPEEVHAFVLMGAARMNTVRAEKYAALKALGYSFANYIHSSNEWRGKATIAENCFILDRQSFNLETAVGNNVVMWSGCHLGDGSRIEDDCFLAAQVVINGSSAIGQGSYLASNCTIANGVEVGTQTFVGANALIGKSTAERSVHVVEPTPALEMDSLRFIRLLRHDV
jgi:acetyltransferase-like isoleucine patch superfamily enzyme